MPYYICKWIALQKNLEPAYNLHGSSDGQKIELYSESKHYQCSRQSFVYREVQILRLLRESQKYPFTRP